MNCQLWRGSLDKDGYGTAYVRGRKVRAHRWAWELENGPIPKGLLVLHACNNPPCVRVSHLYLGTQKENIAQRDAQGRRGDARGHPKKLTAEQVQDIRRTYALAVPPSQLWLAQEYGVHPSTISRIIARLRWPEGGYNLCRP